MESRGRQQSGGGKRRGKKDDGARSGCGHGADR